MPASLSRVVCADDEQDIVDIVEACLGMLPDCEVFTCNDGKAAIEATRRTRPDIVLLDVMMPIMDGPTALRALKEDPELSAVPVILMTARIQPKEVAEYLSLGATAVIPKPFDPMSLADEVLKIWGDATAV